MGRASTVNGKIRTFCQTWTLVRVTLAKPRTTPQHLSTITMCKQPRRSPSAALAQTMTTLWSLFSNAVTFTQNAMAFYQHTLCRVAQLFSTTTGVRAMMLRAQTLGKTSSSSPFSTTPRLRSSPSPSLPPLLLPQRQHQHRHRHHHRPMDKWHALNSGGPKL